jgi:hypothetical protein
MACSVCLFSDNLEHMYQCEYCKKNFHFNCVEYFDQKNIEISIDNNSIWYCNECIPYNSKFYKEPLLNNNLNDNDINKIANLTISGLLNDGHHSKQLYLIEILKNLYGEKYNDIVDYYNYLGYSWDDS